MKIVEEKRKNVALFGDISVGTIFRFNAQIFIKTEKFFSAQSIDDFLSCNNIMKNIDNMRVDLYAYTAFCISRETMHCPFTIFCDDIEVEIINAELHIV